MESPTQKHQIYTYKTKSGLQLFSFNTVLLDDWLVKASLTSADTIVVIMQNIETGSVATGFFTDENKANDFVNLHTQGR